MADVKETFDNEDLWNSGAAECEILYFEVGS